MTEHNDRGSGSKKAMIDEVVAAFIIGKCIDNIKENLRLLATMESNGKTSNNLLGAKEHLLEAKIELNIDRRNRVKW